MINPPEFRGIFLLPGNLLLFIYDIYFIVIFSFCLGANFYYD
jgi:hypothetical protein